MKILNASEPGLGSSMTEEEVRNFLSTNKLFARLGTIDEKEDPNIHPVWYILIIVNSTLKQLRNQRKLEISGGEIIFTFV